MQSVSLQSSPAGYIGVCPGMLVVMFRQKIPDLQHYREYQAIRDDFFWIDDCHHIPPKNRNLVLIDCMQFYRLLTTTNSGSIERDLFLLVFRIAVIP
jgi:hypothetical protein